MKTLILSLLFITSAWAQDPAQKQFEFVRGVMRGEISAKLTSDEQLKLLEENIQKYPTHAMSYHLLARTVMNRGAMRDGSYRPEFVKKSQVIIAQGIKAVPNHRGLYIVYLRGLVEQGKKDEVRRVLPKVLDMGQYEDLRDYTFMAEIYQKLGEPGKAIDVLRLGQSPMKSAWEKIELHKELGQAYEYMNQYESCVEAYRVVQNLQPKNEKIHFHMPKCLIGLKKLDEAMAMAKSSHHESEGPKCQVIAQMHLLRGDEYLNQKELDKAFFEYEHSIAEVPSPLAHLGLAKIAFAKGDHPKTLKHIDDGGKLLTKSDESYYFLGAHIFDGQWEQYIALLKTGLARVERPLNKLWAYNKIGFGLHKLKKREEMYEVMDKAIEIGEELLRERPDDRLAYFHLGSSYCLYGTDADNKELLVKGIGLLKKSKEMDPNDTAIDPILNHSMKVVEMIDAGKVPPADLNWNLKIKKVNLLPAPNVNRVNYRQSPHSTSRPAFSSQAG